MHVVATAGHVDHGKSTLVRALTGVEPDRCEEERRSLVAVVDEHAARHPTDPCLPAEAARRALELPDRALVEALVTAVASRHSRPRRPPINLAEGR
jgi:translation elongation factor EF-Tu-like GTPase